MKTHLLQFIPLEPQPVGATTFSSVLDLTDGVNFWPVPEGWSEVETTTQTLFGQECWVRMADHLFLEREAGE